MSSSSTSTTRPISAIEKSLLGVKIEETPALIPGLLLAILLAWISIWLSEFLGVTVMHFEKTPISSVMMAILLGLIVSNIVRLPALFKPGLSFAVKKILRLGIIFLGIRLSIFDVFKLGALGIPIVIVCIIGALVITSLINKWLKLPERLGTLIAVGTSICGVSAIVATAPAIDAEDEEVAYAVAVITIFGLIATLAYPYLAYTLFAGDPVRAGLFLGTAIHDTSQVTGAGLVFADVFGLPKGLDVATVTKLVRNVFMAAVIPLMAFYYTRKNSGEGASKQIKIAKLLPLFILGFLGFAVLRSIGDAGINAGANAFGIWDATAWKGIYTFFKEWAVNFLVVALAGVGLSTRFSAFKGLGVKPFLVGLGAALIVGVVSFGAISIFGTWITL